MATKNLNLGEFNVSSTDRLRVVIKKDGVAWNLSGGSVTVTFQKPDQVTEFVRPMIAENAAGGIFYYDTPTSEIDVDGYWQISITATDGTITKIYPYEIRFHVNSRP